jgi:hypothetical protein
MYGGVDVRINIFLTSALVGGEWLVSRSCRFTPGERAPGTRWIEGWVGPRVCLDDMEQIKFLTLPVPKLRPHGRPARSRHYTDRAIRSMIISEIYLHHGFKPMSSVSSVSSIVIRELKM